jgi:tight adherence protein B
MMPAAQAGLLSALAFSAAAWSVQCASRRRLRERAGCRLEGSGASPPGRPGGAEPVLGPPSGRWKRKALALAAISCCFLVAGPTGAVLGLAAAAALPRILRSRRATRERALLDEQLTEAVSSIGAGIRAGFSLAQALRFAAQEGSPPLSGSMAAVVDRSAMGMPLGTSIDVWSDAQGGRDVRLVAGVLRLHGRSGGDLPAVLDRLAETLRDRRSAARDVRSLTAQARMSGAILGFLPLVFFAFLGLTAPHDLGIALRSPTGLSALIVGLVMQTAAFLWIRYLLRVE